MEFGNGLQVVFRFAFSANGSETDIHPKITTNHEATDPRVISADCCAVDMTCW